MDMKGPVEVVLRCFDAVERRDDQRLSELLHPNVEFHWPPSFPYGGEFRGFAAVQMRHPTWSETWEPMQPTEAEQRMDPRVVAASENEVVVLWRQRGISSEGERFDSPVLGLYQVRDGRLERAQMFYFDPEAAMVFLERANAEAKLVR
jgi:ketosteroid isomerase-like protein